MEVRIWKKDIVRKLTSQKFWLSLVSSVSLLLIALGKDRGTAETVAALIMAGASVIGYANDEDLADGGNGVMTIDQADLDECR